MLFVKKSEFSKKELISYLRKRQSPKIIMTIDSENLGIPQTLFTSICTLPAGQFFRICKQFVGLSESIRIKTNKENIKFSINGQIGSGSSTLQQDTGSQSDSIFLDVDEPVSLSFASRYLNLFSKAGGLSSQVILNMSNETALMVMYKIMNNMGILNITQLQKQPKKNDNLITYDFHYYTLSLI